MEDIREAFDQSLLQIGPVFVHNPTHEFDWSVRSGKVGVRNLDDEVRVKRDLRMLLDDRYSCIVIEDTMDGAMECVVEDFVAKGLLGGMGKAEAMEQLCKRRLTDAQGVVDVFALEVPGLPHRAIGLTIAASNATVRAYVITSTTESGTKNSSELALNVASFLHIADARHALERCETVEQVREVVERYVVAGTETPLSQALPCVAHNVEGERYPFLGIVRDVKRRLPHYWSDWYQAFVGPKHLQKTISTTCFIFFAILGPSLALGEEYSHVTNGVIAIQQVLWMQLVGGVAFALLGGQPLVIVMTTAPMTLFAKVILDFFCCVSSL